MPKVPTGVVGKPIIAKSPSIFYMLWYSLKADMYSVHCLYDIKGVPETGRCVQRIPYREDVAEYVSSCIEDLDPYDWWWMPKTDKNDIKWIEISIRTKAVIAIEAKRKVKMRIDI